MLPQDTSIPWIAHHTSVSVFSKLHTLYIAKLVVQFCQVPKNGFANVKRHDRLEMTILEGIKAGKRTRGKPWQRWEQDITDVFGTVTATGRIGKTSVSQKDLGSNRICNLKTHAQDLTYLESCT